MVQIPNSSMALSAMNKFRVLVCAWAFFVCAKAVSAEHEALELLFVNGSARLTVQQLCEPYQLAEAPAVDSQTLAQDIAWVLADMSENSVNTDSSCELDAQGEKLCKVVFSTRDGEFEWARVYQFESVKVNHGDIRLRNLRCFNIP